MKTSSIVVLELSEENLLKARSRRLQIAAAGTWGEDCRLQRLKTKENYGYATVKCSTPYTMRKQSNATYSQSSPFPMASFSEQSASFWQASHIFFLSLIA
jgi:hypothetical protein